MPFGVNHSNLVEFYQFFEDATFFASPKHSAILHYDTQTDFMWELGVATDRYAQDPNTARRDPGEETSEQVPEVGAGLPEEEESIDAVEQGKEPEEALTFRSAIDIAALTGSRIMGSFYGAESGVRKIGFGFVNRSRKGDLTQFELIRRYRYPDIRKGPYEQLIRFGYEGSWRSQSRWLVQFDDNRFLYRMGAIGHDVRFWNHILLRLNVMMRRDLQSLDTRLRDQWYTTIGMEVRL